MRAVWLACVTGCQLDTTTITDDQQEAPLVHPAPRVFHGCRTVPLRRFLVSFESTVLDTHGSVALVGAKQELPAPSAFS